MQDISSDKSNVVSLRRHFIDKTWLGHNDRELQRLLWEDLKRKNTEKLLTIVSERGK